MSIRVAKTAGFCYGVNRAVRLVEESIKQGKSTVTFGPIAHNRHLVSRFEVLGVKEVHSLEEIPRGATVVIRSHGVTREQYEALQSLDAEIIDATCPSVKRIHSLVADAEQRGRQPVIIGTPTHPEVRAIAGWCTPWSLPMPRSWKTGSLPTQIDKIFPLPWYPRRLAHNFYGICARKS